MGFKGRKKGKYVGAEKFIKKIKEIQEEAKAVLEKAQEDMKKYANRKRSDIEEYKVRDLVMLSTKDLKYQMVVLQMVTYLICDLRKEFFKRVQARFR